MTGRELIALLKQQDMDLPVYIEDASFGPVEVYSIEEEQIDEVDWKLGELLRYKKITVIVLCR